MSMAPRMKRNEDHLTGSGHHRKIFLLSCIVLAVADALHYGRQPGACTACAGIASCRAQPHKVLARAISIALPEPRVSI